MKPTKKTNGLLISLLVIGVLVLIALICNLVKGGMWIVYGLNGKSAYDLAVENGYQGTLQEWLASLSGKDGINGNNGADGTNGTDGKNGVNGKNAYELAVENGFRGSLQEWLLSLSFGENGKDGKDGKDGVSVRDIRLDENGNLIFTLTDGSQFNVGQVGTFPSAITGLNDYQKAQAGGYAGTLHEWLCSFVDGSRETTVSDVFRNEKGQLILTLNDGTTLNAGEIDPDGWLSDQADEDGFMPRFESVVMNAETSGLNLRAVPNDLNSGVVRTLNSGTELICTGSAELGGDLFYRFCCYGKACYARAKYFDLKYDYVTAPRELNLPAHLILTAGEAFRFVPEEIMPWANGYYRLAFLYSNEAAVWSADDVSVSLTACFRDGSTTAPHPAEEETLTLILLCTTEQGEKEVFRKTVRVTVCAAEPLPALKGLFIGDSRISMGGLLGSFQEQTGGTIDLIGTLRNDAGISCEGRGGWKAANFWLSGQVRSVTNAFYNEAVGTFDFSWYMAQNYPSLKLDFVVLNLGANDQFSAMSVEYIKNITASIHAYDPEIRILVMTEYIAPGRETPYCADRVRRAQFAYFARMEEAFADAEDRNVWLVPAFLCVDTLNDRIFSVNETGDPVIADYVHLGPVGYAREAAVIRTYLTYLFSESR